MCQVLRIILPRGLQVSKALFKTETGLVDDVLDRAWADFKKQSLTFAKWWAVSQGHYV